MYPKYETECPEKICLSTKVITHRTSSNYMQHVTVSVHVPHPSTNVWYTLHVYVKYTICIQLHYTVYECIWSCEIRSRCHSAQLYTRIRIWHYKRFVKFMIGHHTIQYDILYPILLCLLLLLSFFIYIRAQCWIYIYGYGSVSTLFYYFYIVYFIGCVSNKQIYIFVWWSDVIIHKNKYSIKVDHNI